MWPGLYEIWESFTYLGSVWVVHDKSGSHQEVDGLVLWTCLSRVCCIVDNWTEVLRRPYSKVAGYPCLALWLGGVNSMQRPEDVN